MKLKLQFIIAAFIALVIYIPVTHGQANLSFSGGSGAPLATTLQNPVTYIVTNNSCGINVGPGFVFDEAGNPFGGVSRDITGTITYSINGGPARSITRIVSGGSQNSFTANDLIIFGALPGVSTGDRVVLSAGTLTTAGTVAGARPNNGSFTTFLTSSAGIRCSSDGVAATPTAATVSVSGHATSPLGRGITGVNLSLIDSDGNTKTTISTAGGYFEFTDVRAGETYIISATGKRFTFSQPVQVLNINEETNEVNFIADSDKRLRTF